MHGQMRPVDEMLDRPFRISPMAVVMPAGGQPLRARHGRGDARSTSREVHQQPLGGCGPVLRTDLTDARILAARWAQGFMQQTSPQDRGNVQHTPQWPCADPPCRDQHQPA
jgi:hypothetical protein